MRAAIRTDAWLPQVNGVVRTLGQTLRWLEAWGHRFTCINPGTFTSFPLPTYPDIRLAWRPGPKMTRTLEELRPEAIHIATEGPIGLAGGNYRLRNGLQFTTAYHSWEHCSRQFLLRFQPVDEPISDAVDEAALTLFPQIWRAPCGRGPIGLAH